jgi:pimeloyl-ACP methyl ester carboxylesterase
MSMTVVLVHGVPETDVIWTLLIAALGRDDITTLSPPGFGTPVPAGFAATHVAYRDWLVSELESFDEPVDLVGHDWGGAHVMNVVMCRPDLVRSWASDVLGLFHPGYVWHDLALTWQTHGVGEQLAHAMSSGSVEDRASRFAEYGVPVDLSIPLAAAQTADMGRVILALYRSSRQPAMAQAGRSLRLAAARPGLSLLAPADHYVGSEEIRRQAADHAGAKTEVLHGLGHWWMTQDPARSAAALTAFWGSVSDPRPGLHTE